MDFLFIIGLLLVIGVGGMIYFMGKQQKKQGPPSRGSQPPTSAQSGEQPASSADRPANRPPQTPVS